MNYTRLLLLFFIAGTIAFSRAQDNSKDSVKTTVPASAINHFHDFRFSFNRISLLNENFFQAGHFRTGRMGLKTSYPSFSGIDQPLITRDNYSQLSRRDLYYHYDPANPYGERTPADALFTGGTDYLFWLLFEK